MSRIWAAVVPDGSSFVEAKQAGLVGGVVAVCLLLLALAKLGSAALETLSDVLETSSEMSSTSTDKFLDWKYCVALGHFSLNFSSSLFLFLFSLPLRNRFMLNSATAPTPHDKLSVTEHHVTWNNLFHDGFKIHFRLILKIK